MHTGEHGSKVLLVNGNCFRGRLIINGNQVGAVVLAHVLEKVRFIAFAAAGKRCNIACKLQGGIELVCLTVSCPWGKIGTLFL